MARTTTFGKIHGDIKFVILTCDPPYSMAKPGFISRETKGYGGDEVVFTPDIWNAMVFHKREELVNYKKSVQSRTKRMLLTHEAVFRLRTSEDEV